AGALGSTVRRLRQRGPGDDRPVHRRGRGEVAADVRSGDASPPRIRGTGAGTLERAAREVPTARSAGEPAGGELYDFRPVLPPAAAAGAAARTRCPAADRDEPEEPAPTSARRIPAPGPLRGSLPPGARRPTSRGARRGDHPDSPVQREGLRRPCLRRSPEPYLQRRARAGRGALPLPEGGAESAAPAVSQPPGDRLGAGGTEEHGRLDVHGAAASGAGGGEHSGPVRGPAAPGEPR